MVKIVIFILAFFASLYSSEVRLESEQDFVRLNAVASHYLDHSGTKSFTEMLSLVEDRWDYEPTSLNRKTSHSWAIWSKMVIQVEEDNEYFLEFDAPLVNRLNLYVVNDSGHVDSVLVGQGTRGESQMFPHWNYVIPVFLKAGQPTKVLIKYKSSQQMAVPVRLWHKNTMHESTHDTAMFHGIFDGLLIGVALLVFLSYISFRDRTYLYYIFTLVSFVLFISFYSGFGLRFFVPRGMELFFAFMPSISVLLLMVSLLEFTRKYLNTSKEHPAWDIWLRHSGLVVGISIVAGLLIDPDVFGRWVPHLALIGILIILLPSLFFLRQRIDLRWFVLGMGLPLMVGSALAIQSMGYIHSDTITIEHLYMSFLLNVIFIGTSLGRRLRMIHQEAIDLQQQMFDHLTRTDKLKDEFLANTTHELKTPLNGVVGIADAMLEDKNITLPIQTRRNLQLIVTCGMRLSNLINDILDYAHLKQGSISLQLQAVSLWRTVEMVFIVVQPLARKKGLELRHEIPESFPLVYADPDRLQQILINLVGNAIKFTEKGYVLVSANIIDEREIEVIVQDTGIGIASNHQERIFDMFQQLDATIARVHGGTGIGLSLTRKLVLMHQGKIHVESALGKGSKFIFTIPKSAKNAEAFDEAFEPLPVIDDDHGEIFQPIDHMNSTGRNISGRIMVVDDEPVNLQVLVNQLAVEGFEVDVASNGKEAIKKIENNGPPDLVLLDLMMPGFSGFDVCLQIRREYDASRLPIIILTAKNQVSELVKGLEWGANDFLAKPFSKPELLSRIRTHLALARLHKSYVRFVPQEFLEQMGRASITDVQLGDQLERHLSILVADIRNFTALSESMNPGEIFDFLNTHLERMVPMIRSHNGFVSRFVGDAIVALFPDGPDHALSAAQSMNQATKQWSPRHPRTGVPISISMGIAVHMGKVILGTVGFEGRMDVTVISERIRQTARLESCNKIYGTSILLSTDVWRLCDQSRFASRIMGRMHSVGDTSVLEYRELITLEKAKSNDARIKTIGNFERAVENILGGQFQDAIANLDTVLIEDQFDEVARLMRHNCLELMRENERKEML